jgi:hypothetical protein
LKRRFELSNKQVKQQNYNNGVNVNNKAFNIAITIRIVYFRKMCPKQDMLSVTKIQIAFKFIIAFSLKKVPITNKIHCYKFIRTIIIFIYDSMSKN